VPVERLEGVLNDLLGRLPVIDHESSQRNQTPIVVMEELRDDRSCRQRGDSRLPYDVAVRHVDSLDSIVRERTREGWIG
jgi:hypothetical protein